MKEKFTIYLFKSVCIKWMEIISNKWENIRRQRWSSNSTLNRNQNIFRLICDFCNKTNFLTGWLHGISVNFFLLWTNALAIAISNTLFFESWIYIELNLKLLFLQVPTLMWFDKIQHRKTFRALWMEWKIICFPVRSVRRIFQQLNFE